MPKTPIERRLLWGLALANFAVVLWFFQQTLTVIPNTGDEHSVLFQAKIFSGLRIAAPAPAHADKFLAHYVAVTGGRWGSIYPPGYPALLALGAALGSVPAVVALISSGSLLLVFVLVQELYRDAVLSWAATLLLAVSPSFRFYSASYSTHMGALLFVLACLLFLARGESQSGARARWWGLWAAAAGLGATVRPFSMFLACLPMAVYAATSAAPKAAGRWTRVAWPLAPLAAAGAIVIAYSAFQSGRFGHSDYLEIVNSGGRLGAGRNLNWRGVARLGSMVADTAKWTFGYGIFRSGNLKEVCAGDWNLSLPLLAAGLLFGLWEARLDRRLRRVNLLLLGVAASMVLGHLFYDKEGGRFGERRFFEAQFVFCVFTARMLLAGRRRAARRWGWLLLPALAGANLCVYLPGTAVWIRQSNEDRFQLFLMLERLGIREALIFVRDVPEFDRAFYARNAPDLSGNVFAVAGAGDEEVARMFPFRPKYLFVYDWKLQEYALRKYGKKI